ncbi:cache domain-containing protein [Oleidesulfovibrio sp.]|uniref:cache domain-containing protein n=1 Tax=Oleidesulfovibrio sp. TaxID=2909707 RepID=UPI003A8B40DB
MRANATIAGRIGLLLLFLIVFATAIGLTYTYYIKLVQTDSLAEVKSATVRGYERTLRYSVQSMAASLSDAMSKAEERGEDPILVLRRFINAARYDSDGYYFVYDLNGINVAHPVDPDFQGTNRLEHQDKDGVPYISILANLAREGGGYVSYSFHKPGETTPLPKLAYAELIPGTPYWLATGIYTDNIQSEQENLAARLDGHTNNALLIVGVGVTVTLIFFVLPTSLYMVSGILKPWRQMEKELRHAQKMEAIGIFAGGIAHDFNNILGAITSCSELALADTPDHSPVQEDLRHVLKAARRGKNLVKRIKAFSQRSDVTKTTVQVRHTLQECIQLLQTFIPATVEIRLRINAPSVLVKADSDQLLQVLMNLCTNAEQAMRGMKGVLEISLDLETLDADQARPMGLSAGRYVVISVKDTGTGMKPVVIKHIFEPFYTTRKKSGGTGLGLSITQNIVRLHGGIITVDSAPNKGSTFTVYLPCHGMAEEEIIPNVKPELHRGSESLLIVDDDDDLVYSVGKLFSRLGYKVTSTTRSRDALDMFRNRPDTFDLVLTDQMMPDLTGVELTRELLAIRPELPVIMYTGFEGRGNLSRYPKDWRTVGVAAFFSKPFDTSALSAEVRNQLDKQHSTSVHQ